MAPLPLSLWPIGSTKRESRTKQSIMSVDKRGEGLKEPVVGRGVGGLPKEVTLNEAQKSKCKMSSAGYRVGEHSP